MGNPTLERASAVVAEARSTLLKNPSVTPETIKALENIVVRRTGAIIDGQSDGDFFSTITTDALEQPPTRLDPRTLVAKFAKEQNITEDGTIEAMVTFAHARVDQIHLVDDYVMEAMNDDLD